MLISDRGARVVGALVVGIGCMTANPVLTLNPELQKELRTHFDTLLLTGKVKECAQLVRAWKAAGLLFYLYASPNANGELPLFFLGRVYVRLIKSKKTSPDDITLLRKIGCAFVDHGADVQAFHYGVLHEEAYMALLDRSLQEMLRCKCTV